MWWKAFLVALGLIFVAELGDKTQIVILTMSAKYGLKQVFTAAAAAFALLNILAVSIGVVLYEFLPQSVIKYTVSAIFIISGIIMLLSQRVNEETDKKVKEKRSPFLSIFLFVCLMELGDKTQLSLIALTAKYSQPVFVFMGGTLALWATSLIGALVGVGLGRIVPPIWIHRVSGLIFIAFGIINLF
jgi:putative Ca2+/H+ antiporter (TMEM165/GDT1 family)